MTTNQAPRALTPFESHLARKIRYSVPELSRYDAATIKLEESWNELRKAEKSLYSNPVEAAEKALLEAQDEVNESELDLREASIHAALLAGQVMGFKAGVICVSEALSDPRATPGTILSLIATMADDGKAQEVIASLSSRLFVKAAEE